MRRADPRLVASSLLAVMVLAGCSSGGIPKREDEAQVRARFAAYAGEPIDRMSWMGQYYSWEPVGENQLVVFTTPSDAYLLKVSGPCTDLKFVTSIGLTSTGARSTRAWIRSRCVTGAARSPRSAGSTTGACAPTCAPRPTRPSPPAKLRYR